MPASTEASRERARARDYARGAWDGWRGVEPLDGEPAAYHHGHGFGLAAGAELEYTLAEFREEIGPRPA